MAFERNGGRLYNLPGVTFRLTTSRATLYGSDCAPSARKGKSLSCGGVGKRCHVFQGCVEDTPGEAQISRRGRWTVSWASFMSTALSEDDSTQPAETEKARAARGQARQFAIQAQVTLLQYFIANASKSRLLRPCSYSLPKPLIFENTHQCNSIKPTPHTLTTKHCPLIHTAEIKVHKHHARDPSTI